MGGWNGSKWGSVVGSGWRAIGCGVWPAAWLCSGYALPFLPAADGLSSLCVHPSTKQVFYRVAPDPTLACINEGLHVSAGGCGRPVFAPMLPCFAKGLLGVTAYRLSEHSCPSLLVKSFWHVCSPCHPQEMREFRPDVIIALGGGSPMDAAKIAWLM